jgi:hypothetical protein
VSPRRLSYQVKPASTVLHPFKSIQKSLGDNAPKLSPLEISATNGDRPSQQCSPIGNPISLVLRRAKVLFLESVLVSVAVPGCRGAVVLESAQQTKAAGRLTMPPSSSSLLFFFWLAVT